MAPSKKLGVVIGRFQLHELHEGHLFLLDRVSGSHEQMLILVGHNTIRFTTDDPFPFAVRKQMLENRYPQATILPLKDSPISNEDWSHTVDQKISAVSQNGDAIIYGGRDSFIPKYSGGYQTKEVAEFPNVSATNVREEAGSKMVNSPLFRQGWLAAVNSQYPVTDATVDMAVVTSDISRILMGRRGTESVHVRFFGGFVDPQDDSKETAAMREFSEEVVGVEVTAPLYICSQRIDDPRYGRGAYGVMTTFFALVCRHETDAYGADDMPHVEWRDLDESLYTDIAPEHQVLLEKLLAYKKSR